MLLLIIITDFELVKCNLTLIKFYTLASVALVSDKALANMANIGGNRRLKCNSVAAVLVPVLGSVCIGS